MGGAIDSTQEGLTPGWGVGGTRSLYKGRNSPVADLFPPAKPLKTLTFCPLRYPCVLTRCQNIFEELS